MCSVCRLPNSASIIHPGETGILTGNARSTEHAVEQAMIRLFLSLSLHCEGDLNDFGCRRTTAIWYTSALIVAALSSGNHIRPVRTRLLAVTVRSGAIIDKASERVYGEGITEEGGGPEIMIPSSRPREVADC